MFATDKASDDPMMKTVCLRHARYVVSRNEELMRSRRGLSGATAIAEVSHDRCNLEVAAERMASTDHALARRAAVCLAELYELIGPASQAIPILESALAWARGPAERAEVRYHFGRALVFGYDADGRLDVVIGSQQGCALFTNSGGGRFRVTLAEAGELLYISKPNIVGIVSAKKYLFIY